VSGRSADEILRDDIHVDPGPILSSGGVTVRQQPPAVIVKDASGPIEAVYRNDVGCTLVQTVPEADVYRQFTTSRTPPPAPSAAAWPDGEGAPAPLPKDVNAAVLDEAMTYAFSEPPPKAPTGRYGAQFWLNAGDPADPSKRPYPNVPTDMFAMIGYLGQAVVIVHPLRVRPLEASRRLRDRTRSLDGGGGPERAALLSGPRV